MHKILVSFKGSPDGFTVIEYTEGEEVELSDELAEVAEDEGWAEPVKEKPVKPELSAGGVARKKVIQGELSALGKKLKSAADADKPAIQAEMDKLKTELSELK